MHNDPDLAIMHHFRDQNLGGVLCPETLPIKWSTPILTTKYVTHTRTQKPENMRKIAT